LSAIDADQEHDVPSICKILRDRGSSLQGFPWENFSCSLDAVLLNFIVILEATGLDAGLELEASESDILRTSVEEGYLLAKTPWPQRTVGMMRNYRDNIKGRLSEMNVTVTEK